MKQIGDVLTDGLLAGYAGGKIDDVIRGEFKGKKSLPSLDGGTYHDEWFVPTHVGGGQELVLIGEEKFTRLYAGGTPKPDIMISLGIAESDVNKYLINKIVELKNTTRLFEDCMPEPDGDWKYSYIITSKNDEIGVTTGMEQIDYKGTTVHIHAFILSPVI